MKLPSILKLLPVLPLFVGCTETDDSLEHERAINAWMINAMKGEAIDSAIVKQRTLYAYHFVDETARLNNLGKSDLHILAGHFRRYPGTLSVRQGEVANELYLDRVETVRQYLDDTGVDLEDVEIVDGLPGGQGATKDRVIKSLDDSDSGVGNFGGWSGSGQSGRGGMTTSSGGGTTR